MADDSRADWGGALARARAHAPFLAVGLDRQPELEAMLAQGNAGEALALARTSGADKDVAATLRRQRWALAVTLAIGDLAGAFSVERVMHELSDFADRTLDAAIAEAIRRRVPEAQPAGFTALALGKHGARELNYSSDIDPILLYDPARLPSRERDDPAEAAQRYARTILSLLSDQTEDGYVFRVDLRLRPASEVSPLAISFEAALTHYESSAIAWERAAFIRARSAAGDVAAGEAFLRSIASFVWRRSLDFTALEEIRRLTSRIRDHHKGPGEPGPGFDLKRGRGGIREIEFFAQAQQLIHGGRNPALQVRGTRAGLDALAEAGIVSRDDAALLGESYDRLRIIEHRLQMIEDRQTHCLPREAQAIDNVARLDGLADGAALVGELKTITAQVAMRYDSLLAGTGGRAQRPSTTRDNAAVGRIEQRIDKWRETLRTLRGSEARAALAALRPTLVDALAGSPEPDRSMTRLETILDNVPTAINLFRLFEARPGLLDQVLRVVTLAEPLAEALGRHPEWLDGMIDARALDLPGSVADLSKLMRSAQPDYERRLDRIREVVGEQRFALGVQLVEARHDPLEIGAGLARVAEAALDTGAAAAAEEFATVHGRIAGSDLLILGLGRLGGGVLTHASDLDIIYLFTGEIGVESQGGRPLTASLYYNRLAQRVTGALSVPTAAGALYEIDTRLRPQGTQGPLAVSLDSFARYQREDAWTWEHMALARARPLFGPPDARAELRQVIEQVLRQERDPEKLRTDVLKMRSEIAANKSPSGPLDAKLQRGGLIDCEFIIHYLQLRERTGFSPDLEIAVAELTSAGLLPRGFSKQHDFLTRLLIAARLLAPDGQVPADRAQEVLARCCGTRDFAALLRRVEEARHVIAAAWTETFGQTLEVAA
jgi:glutamate-ammonia-ligase adenylyltransferase